MNASAPCIYEFDEFRIDSEKRVLMHNGRVVPLTPKVFETLLQLVQHQGDILTKDELMQAIWPDTVVEENNLNQNISVLRRVFKERSGNDRYILTVPGTGYRFAARVEILNGAHETRGTMSPGFPSSGSLAETKADVPPAEQTEGRRRMKIGIAIFVAVLLLFAGVSVWRSAPHLPTVANTVQITNDRKAKIPINGLVTDGVHFYFMEGEPWGSGSGIAQVSAVGGETTWISTSLKETLAILDISPDKSKLLLVAGAGGGDSGEFWVQPLPAGTPRRVGNLKAFNVDWTPDGSHFIYSNQHKIEIANEDGSDPKTIAEIPGSATWFHYSPDGRLVRFSLLQDMGNFSSLWEMRANGTNLHQLLPHWNESLDKCCGRWSPDGNYYYFLTGSFFFGGGGPSQGIWVMPEHRSIFRRDIAPTRLTTGPLRFGAPTPSSDGKRIFAVGDESRVELFSYDPHAQRFDPYLGGVSAGPVAFSPDGKWVAYVAYPEMTLWKSRTDLSEKMQLTFAPFRAYGPRWSPDGSQITFGDVQFHRSWKIYLVSASGGESPKQIAPSNVDDADTDPTWTPDGKSIFFARAPGGERGGQAIYRVDLGSGNLTLIPGSKGLFSPRISPDGRYLAALAEDATKLTLLDRTTNSWSTFAEAEHFAFNEWSLDGKYVYARESRGGFAEIVRVRIKDRVREDVLSLKDFPAQVDPFANWYGLTPDGKVLLMRDRSVQEIYALDLNFR